MALATASRLRKASSLLDQAVSTPSVSSRLINFLSAAARAMLDNSDLTAEEIARKAMKIAADLCVYTNHNVTVEIIEADP